MKSLPFLFTLILFTQVVFAQVTKEEFIYKDTAGHVLEGKALEEYARNGVNMKKMGMENGKRVAILTPIKKEEAEKEQKELEEKLNSYIGKPLPAYLFKTLKNHYYTNKNVAGNVIVFNFWYVGCEPCAREMPDLNKLVSRYKGKKVLFIAPSFTQKEKILPFIKRWKFNYEIVPGAEWYINKLAISLFPTHFILDKKGIVRNAYAGYTTAIDQKLSKDIDRLVNE